MTTRTRSVACTCAVLMLGVAAISFSKEEPAAPAYTPQQQEEMMKAWIELGNPGKQHEKLMTMVGEWDAVSKMYMAGPDGPVNESKGTATFRSVLGGRFVEGSYQGEVAFPGPDGKPQSMKFEGLSLLGYDNYKKAYTGVWADSMGTVLLTYKGTQNPQTPDEFSMYGEMDEPGLGLQDRMVKYHQKHLGRDKFVFSMYDLAVNDHYKVMEITYTRRSPSK